MTLSVKYEDLNARITEVRYHRVEGTTSTVCTVILHSGFVVVGHSAALNSEAFVAETGSELAYLLGRVAKSVGLGSLPYQRKCA